MTRYRVKTWRVGLGIEVNAIMRRLCLGCRALLVEPLTFHSSGASLDR
jgi:hypothetical protein